MILADPRERGILYFFVFNVIHYKTYLVSEKYKCELYKYNPSTIYVIFVYLHLHRYGFKILNNY